MQGDFFGCTHTRFRPLLRSLTMHIPGKHAIWMAALICVSLSPLVKVLEEVIWIIEMRTRHCLAGDASYLSNNGGKTQLPPSQCSKTHVCFPEEKALPKGGQKSLLEKAASQLSVHPTSQDLIAKCWTHRLSVAGQSRFPPRPWQGLLLFQAMGLQQMPLLPSILACVKLCGGLVKSTNSCNESHEEDEEEGGVGPIFRRTTTLCYLLSESWPSQQIKPFLLEKGFKWIVTLQAKLFSWLLNDTSPHLSFGFYLSPGL